MLYITYYHLGAKYIRCIQVYTGVYGVIYLRNELKSAVTGIYSLPPFDCNAP